MTFNLLKKQRNKFYQILLTLLTLLPVFSSLSAPNNEANWTVWKNRDSLIVKYRNSYIPDQIEIKAQLEAKSSLSGFLLFLADTELTPKWLTGAKHSRIVRQISDNENIFTTEFETFWPASPRDIVIRSKYLQQPDLAIEINIVDARDKLPTLKNTVRIKLFHAQWRIKPLANGMLDISYNFIADGGGNMPTWLANRITLNSTWQTIVQLQARLPGSKWQAKSLPNIREQNKADTK